MRRQRKSSLGIGQCLRCETVNETQIYIYNVPTGLNLLEVSFILGIFYWDERSLVCIYLHTEISRMLDLLEDTHNLLGVRTNNTMHFNLTNKL